MPLLDHFRPPLNRRRHWDSFHGAWAEAVARHLNEDLLPEPYFAEARVNIRGVVEIDVAAFEDEAVRHEAPGNGAVAVWAPARPTATATLDFSALDVIEVQIIDDSEGPRVVAAVEFISPANKDRPASRKMFAVKCAAYLQEGIAVAVVDVVTERHGNLHAALLKLLKAKAKTPGMGLKDLYAAAYRPIEAAANVRLEVWAKMLALGAPLPTLPLWIGPDLAVPLDLEAAYVSACAARRIRLDS